MAIVIGSVVGLVFLILCVILGIHVERTVRKNRKKAETPDGSESERVLSKDGNLVKFKNVFLQNIRTSSGT